MHVSQAKSTIHPNWELVDANRGCSVILAGVLLPLVRIRGSIVGVLSFYLK